MKSLFKKIQTDILIKTIWPVLKWLAPTIATACVSFLETVTLLEISFLGPTILARLSLVLLVSTFVLLAYVWDQFRNKKNKYEFDKALGLWEEIGTDCYICSSCKSKNIISPMRETDEKFICPIKECGHIAYKKGHGPPMQKTISSDTKSSFLSGLDRYIG